MHHTTPSFWNSYQKLPRRIQKLADKNYRLLAENPGHISLHFKKIRTNLWSVRVGRDYRALATMEEGVYLWFWIGSHAEYDLLLKQ